MLHRFYSRSLSLMLACALALAAPAAAAPSAAFAAPVASSFSATVPANRQSIVQLQGSDADGTALTFAIVAGPSHGTLSGLNASTGSVVYTPVATYTGADSFTFNVTSGGDTSSTATATLTVSNQKTTISDFIVNSSGAGRSGKVTFVLTQPVTTPSGIAPVGSSVSASLGTNGAFTVQIYPSRSLNPAAYYQVWWTDGSNQELIGVYDIPLSTTTVSLAPYKVTDTNLAARYTFASVAGLSALVTAVSNSAVALLLSESRTTGRLQYWDGDNFTDSIVSQSGATATVAGSLTATGTITASSYSGIQAADVPALDASKIASGVFDASRVPNLDAAKITTGTLGAPRIPDLDGSKITTGQVANARTTAASANTPNAIVARDSSGNFSAGRVTATHLEGDGSGITSVGVGTSTGHSAAGSVTIQADSDNNSSGILDEMTGTDLSRRMHNSGEQEFFFNVKGVSAQLPDKGAQVFNVETYGAVVSDGTNDKAAIQAAIDAAEAAGGGTVLVPRGGTYNVTGTASDAQLLLIEKSIKLQCVPGAEILMSVPGADTTHGLRVAPASTAPSYNVLSQLEIDGCRFVPASGTAPGGHGVFYDTSGSLTQIRNARMTGTHIGTPAAEFGDYALAMTNSTGAADTQFTNSFEDIWLYGGIRIDKVGDSLDFKNVRVASNVPDRPSMYINLVAGATGPNVCGGSMTAGGGVVILSAVKPTFGCGAIIETANTSLTTAANTPAVIQVKGGGVVPVVKGATFDGITLISHVPGVHGIIAHQSDRMEVGTNYYAIPAAGIAGNDPVYGLSRSTLYFVNTTATATNTHVRGFQQPGPDNLATAFKPTSDPFFSFSVISYNNGVYFNQGNLSMLGYITSSSGFSHGTGLPIWEQGTGSPEGVLARRNGSIYSDRTGGPCASVYVKTTAEASNTGWQAVCSGGGGGGLSDPGSNGMLARTALNTTAARAITGTAGVVTVTNGDGVSGNPTISLDAPPAFTTPSFINSWAAVGGAQAAPGYTKHHGIVYLQGLITSGAASSYAFTLPSGYRPSGIIYKWALSAGGACYIQIEADGDVFVPACYSSNISLDGVSFRAAP